MYLRTTTYVAFIVAASVLSANECSADKPDQHGRRLLTPQQIALVESYFSADGERRDELIKEIEAAFDGKVWLASNALWWAVVWTPPASDSGTFTVGEGVDAFDVAYRLPAGYDVSERHPAIVVLPGDEVSSEQALDQMEVSLGDEARRFIRLCPTSHIGPAFHQALSSVGAIDRLVVEARRRFRIDSDRVIVYGFETGADAAWMAAIMHPDLFASAVCISGFPKAPYPEQTYAIVLPNLQRLSVFTGWGGTARATDVRSHLSAILTYAKGAGIPISEIGFSALYEAGGKVTELSYPRFDKLVSSRIMLQKRPRLPKKLSHWFRYPGQGRAGWLEATRPREPVWTSEQLAVLASPGTDRDAYISSVLRDKLAYVGGRIDGQTIHIDVRRMGRVEIRLPLYLVNFDEPITVYCNGKKRRTRAVKPSIRTLLGTAAETWDFQRPVVAKISLTVRTEADDKSP